MPSKPNQLLSKAVIVLSLEEMALSCSQTLPCWKEEEAEPAHSLPLLPGENFLPVLWWSVHPAAACKCHLQLPQAEHESLPCFF